MKVTRYYPHHYLGRQILEFNEEGVTITYKNLIVENAHFYKWNEMDDEIYTGKSGYLGWSTFATISLFIGIIISFVLQDLKTISPIIKISVLSIFLIGAGIMYLLQFVKQPYVSFCDKDGKLIFSLSPIKHQSELEYARNHLTKDKSGPKISNETQNASC